MNLKVFIFLLSSLSVCHLYGEQSSLTTAVDNKNEQMETARNNTSKVICKVHSVLHTVCSLLQKHQTDSSYTACHELSLLCACTQTANTKIPGMNANELIHLIDINEAIIDQLQQNIVQENYTNFCNFDTTELLLENDDFIEISAAIDAINYRLNKLETKLAIFSKLFVEIESHFDAISSNNNQTSLFQKITNHSGVLIAAMGTLGMVYLLKDHDPAKIAKAIVTRIPVYSLIALYLLRQKKDSDTKKWVDGCFGNNSLITNTILAVKQWIGSPREKRPAVHIVVRDDMTAAEQIEWAEKNNCEIIKADYKKRSIPYLANFFDMDDSLFKWSFSWIFAQQLRADILALSNLMGNDIELTVKRILGAK